MIFQHDKSWDILIEIVTSKLTAKVAWEKFIGFHEQAVPNPYWNTLRQLDISGEQAELVEWLQQLVIDEPIPNSVVAIWIGILKFADNEKEIPAICLIGADTYDQDDIEWASDPTYLPANRYAQLPILQQIDDTARTDKENYEFLDWILPLAYCTFTLDEIVRTKLEKPLLLKNNTRLFAAVGYDGGDYMDLTTIE